MGIPRSAGTSPDSDQEGSKKTGFQRSISEIVSDDDATNVHEKNLGRLLTSRRRNNSGGVGGENTQARVNSPNSGLTTPQSFKSWEGAGQIK